MASRMVGGAVRTGRFLGSRGGIGLVGIAAGVGLALGVPRLLDTPPPPAGVGPAAAPATRLTMARETSTIPVGPVLVRSDTYRPSWSPLADFRERERLVDIPNRRLPLEELRTLIEGECLVAVQLDPELLRQAGLGASESVAVPRGPVTVERLLDAIATAVSRSGTAVVGQPAVRAVWTFSGNVLHLTSLDRLDAASQVLRVYELSEFVDLFAAADQASSRGEIVAALATVLDDQARQGGAAITSERPSSGGAEPEPLEETRSYAADLVGERLFVNAPERIHDRIAWVLAQIGTQGIVEGEAIQRLRPAAGAGAGESAALPDPGGD